MYLYVDVCVPYVWMSQCIWMRWKSHGVCIYTCKISLYLMYVSVRGCVCACVCVRVCVCMIYTHIPCNRNLLRRLEPLDDTCVSQGSFARGMHYCRANSRYYLATGLILHARGMHYYRTHSHTHTLICEFADHCTYWRPTPVYVPLCWHSEFEMLETFLRVIQRAYVDMLICTGQLDISDIVKIQRKKERERERERAP